VQQVPFDYELIIVDDGSDDATREICAAYQATYIRLENQRYRNPGRARNLGYKLATGDILICQSDEVLHVRSNTIERLVDSLTAGTFTVATVMNAIDDPAGQPVPEQHPIAVVRHDPGPYPGGQYTGLLNPRPLFFLGAIFRKDVCAIGGNDEEFTEPWYEDDWFADCLVRGLKLHPIYLEDVIGLHQDHPRSRYDTTRMRKLYERKVKLASQGRVPFQASGGPWNYIPGTPLMQPDELPTGAVAELPSSLSIC